ncbi:hypothetical protein N7535_004483 [Penicillium sp. DV-2018c]|nr:hypothetical protein N7535_004483 [Penicillium sp. DV-2018c]
MTALQQSTIASAIFVLSTLLLQAITLSTSPGIGEPFNNPDQVTLILERIQALSDVVEKLYKKINPELPLEINNLTPPFAAPRSRPEQLAKFIVTYTLMVTWIISLYSLVDGLQSIRSHALKVYILSSVLVAANLGLIVTLLFLPVREWYMYVSGTIVAGGVGLFYATFTCAKGEM